MCALRENLRKGLQQVSVLWFQYYGSEPLMARFKNSNGSRRVAPGVGFEPTSLLPDNGLASHRLTRLGNPGFKSKKVKVS